jgi:hypothetical protein
VEKQVYIPFASLALDHGAAFFKVMDGGRRTASKRIARRSGLSARRSAPRAELRRRNRLAAERAPRTSRSWVLLCRASIPATDENVVPIVDVVIPGASIYVPDRPRRLGRPALSKGGEHLASPDKHGVLAGHGLIAAGDDVDIAVIELDAAADRFVLSAARSGWTQSPGTGLGRLRRGLGGPAARPEAWRSAWRSVARVCPD